jgi:hypothetical protein
MPATETEWGWFYAESDDAEVYYAADSRQDAIDKGVDAFDERPFFICEARRTALRDDFFDPDRVLEEFEEANEEAWGEDGPNGKATPEMKKELKEALAKTFAAWRKKHAPYQAWCLTDYRNEERIGGLPEDRGQ